MPKAIIQENNQLKVLRSPEYNFHFDKKSGFFARWGATKEDNPEFSEFGPEIADIEISTICHGVPSVGVCKFCYKSNTPRGINMTLETFKMIYSKLPKTVTQIAFGIGDIDSNPDMWPIFDYCREVGIVPNVTMNGAGMTPELAARCASTCGAVAVSLYDTDVTFDTIKMLTDAGMDQINIHFMLSEQTFPRAIKLLQERLTDPRVQKMNAIVFLGLKPKGRSKGRYTVLKFERFAEAVQKALVAKIPLGFDSCSAFKFLKAVKQLIDEGKISNDPPYEYYEQVSEPCESTCFSAYINTDGLFYPCSFLEEEPGFEGGLDVVNCQDFLKDIWHHPKTIAYRERVIQGHKDCRNCAHYDI